METSTPELECAESGINMKCRDCKFAIIGKTKGDTEMAKMGYRICALSRTEVERASYIFGYHLCRWPERRK